MDKALFRSIVPYAVGLAIALVLYFYASTIVYSPRPGQLGPEMWPLLAILLLGASCAFEICRRLIAGNQDATGFLEAFDREPVADDKQPVYPHLLIGGIVLMAIYCGVLFLRIAYVSLPRGIPPFDRATDIFFAIPSLW